MGEEEPGVRRKERETERRIEKRMMKIVAAAHDSLSIRENQPNYSPSVRWLVCRETKPTSYLMVDPFIRFSYL